LEKIITEAKARKKTIARLSRNSKLFKSIINAIKDKKGENIYSLDLRKIDEAVADFFIICEAQSHVQLKAIADNIGYTVEEECDEKPFHAEIGLQWTLVDYVNVVIHIFQKEQRKFYNLESLWADADGMEHND
jgi:ribosome-associated protein